MLSLPRLFSSLTLLAALAGLHGPTTAAGSGSAPSADRQRAPDARVIVKLRPGAASLSQHPFGRGAGREAVRRASQGRADALARRAGVAIGAGRALAEDLQVVHARGLGSAALAARLAADPEVLYAVPDRRMRLLAAPTDPLYAAGPPFDLTAQRGGPEVGQWYLRAPDATFRSAINAQAAWDRARGAPSVVAAVLDTGVRFEHADLAGVLLPGYDMIRDAAIANDGGGRDADATDLGDFITATEANDPNSPFYGGNDCAPYDPSTNRYRAVASSWHGTGVAALIGANAGDGIGMAGVAHGVKVLPVRVLGKCGGYASDIQAGMLWAAGIDQPGLAGSTTPARVINLSLGGGGSCGPEYQETVNRVVAAGTVVVAAAGNSAGQAVAAPANCQGVVSVGGLRHAGSKVGFSDLGPEVTVSAPAGNCVNIEAGEPCLYPILTATNRGTQQPVADGSAWTDGFDISVGTSFATPIVAGTVALMLSARPELTPAQVKAALQSSARAFPSDGADNGSDPTPVTECKAPGSIEQLQCYCPNAPNASLCGAGMLDADGAVQAALALGGPPTVTEPPPDAGDGADGAAGGGSGGGSGGGGSSSSAFVALLLLALACLGPARAGGAAPGTQAAGPGSAGLIVRLRGAADHEAQALGASAPAVAAREQRRWAGLIDRAGLGGRSGQVAPRLRPVGRDPFWLDFGRPLDAGETERIAARLASDPEVDWVAPNRLEQPLALPDDPYFTSGSQWWLMPASGANGNVIADRRRGVPGFASAWQLATPGARGEASPVIAVLDSGITAHPELAGRIVPGYDFVTLAWSAGDGDGRDADPTDPGDGVGAAELAQPEFIGANCAARRSSWHGTVIAGLLAAETNNGAGVAALSHNGRVLPVRVAGKCGASVADIVDGMRWAAGLFVAGAPRNTANPARIVSVSFGGEGACTAAYQAAVDELREAGVLVVAAAGNAHGTVTRPANCRGVVGVAALNRDGFKANYSNFGAELADSGIATVGGDDRHGDAGAWAELLHDGGMTSIWNDGAVTLGAPSYANLFGTSFAAPLVAGTAGLMLSVNPALTVAQLVQGLRTSARPHVTSTLIQACSPANPGRCICDTSTCGAGILDAEQALRFAQAPDTYVAPVRSPVVLDATASPLAQAVALGPDRLGPVAPVDPEPFAVDAGGGGGGGGASSALWLAWLLAALVALGPQRRRVSRPVRAPRC